MNSLIILPAAHENGFISHPVAAENTERMCMKKKWLDSLVEPGTGQCLTLEIKHAQGDEVMEGTLLSAGGSRYPVINGVPRFVPAELYAQNAEIDSDTVQTGRSFGDKWRKDICWELENNEALAEEFREVFFAMLNVSGESELRAMYKDGMTCLNAGCGVAWSEFMFNVNPNVSRFAVDLSLAVDVAIKKTMHLDNVFIAQADLFALPFKDGFFDIIFSAGVLHHTGDAEKSFNNLCRHLKPGGFFGIYIYCVKPFLRELADTEIRKITTEMSFEECYAFSDAVTKLGKAFQQFTDQLIIEEDIPLLNIKRGEYNLQKFIYDHFLKCYYNRGQGHDISAVTNVDWYHPRHASHHTRAEVTSWFVNNGLVDIVFNQPSGWEHSGYFVSGRKP
ncbi:MAG: class I SAM-dependent methyltransferase [Deltaproteobacteria bacterium]|nr:class I SAM-dependent methyltransferase [Deltaproteobacteria bacterium]